MDLECQASYASVERTVDLECISLTCTSVHFGAPFSFFTAPLASATPSCSAGDLLLLNRDSAAAKPGDSLRLPCYPPIPGQTPRVRWKHQGLAGLCVDALCGCCYHR